ncbi:hypothetical protein HHX47_DHR1001115 [Lentinula edodes]|nr:hypothetical protein HHX47_DHR1001115 [Lentinula edodes]
MSASSLLMSESPTTAHCGVSTYPLPGPRIPGQKTAPKYQEASVDTSSSFLEGEEVRMEIHLSSPSPCHPVAPQPLNPPPRKRKKRAGTSGGGQEDPVPISCPRKSVRTTKRLRTANYDPANEVFNRFSIDNTPAEPSKDVTTDMTTELGRITLGTQTSVGSAEYLSWVTVLKSMMEGTLNNVRDMAVSSLVSIARRCDLASKVDGTARFVRMLNELYFAAKVNSTFRSLPRDWEAWNLFLAIPEDQLLSTALLERRFLLFSPVEGEVGSPISELTSSSEEEPLAQRFLAKPPLPISMIFSRMGFQSQDAEGIHQILHTPYVPQKTADPFPADLRRRSKWTEQERRAAINCVKPDSLDKYAQEGYDAPQDIHPLYLRNADGGKTNHSQFLSHPSEDIQKLSQEYATLKEALEAVLQWIVEKVLRIHPDMFQEILATADLLPLNDTSPASPFTSIVVNINVGTLAHRDKNDGYACICVTIGNPKGGELGMYEPKLLIETRNGDVVVFFSHKYTHFNLPYSGTRGSIVIHGDKTGVDYQKDGFGWFKNIYFT